MSIIQEIVQDTKKEIAAIEGVLKAHHFNHKQLLRMSTNQLEQELKKNKEWLVKNNYK